MPPAAPAPCSHPLVRSTVLAPLTGCGRRAAGRARRGDRRRDRPRRLGRPGGAGHDRPERVVCGQGNRRHRQASPAAPAAGGFPDGASGLGGSGSGPPAGRASSSGGSTTTGGGAPANAESIAAKVDPALVDINSTFGSEGAKGAGTGIVLTANGEILTNNHVVDLATSISVTDIGNGKTYPATVVGYDSTKDIAVLQLQGASGLQTAKLGDSSTAAVGDPVVALGNAGGTGGTPSAAAGSITALNQSITAGDDLDGSSEQLSGLIQTNADVQAGDSGGSLVNSSGEVIGVDTAASDGFSFRGGSRCQPGLCDPDQPGARARPARSSPARARRPCMSVRPRSSAC